MSCARRYGPVPRVLLALAITLTTAAQARAATGASFEVSAIITPGCLVDGVGSSGNAGLMGRLDFGTDSALSTATHSANTVTSQSITLRCTPGVALSMTIDGGGHASGGLRHLQAGADTGSRIAYDVCTDAACNTKLAIGGTTGIAVTSLNMNNIRLPVYGRLTLPGNLRGATYTDVLTVTLSW